MPDSSNRGKKSSSQNRKRPSNTKIEEDQK